MKIVIDIPDYDYDCIKADIKSEETIRQIYDAISKGTVLPEDHGRLVDGDLLDSKMYHAAFETDTDFQKWDSGCWIRYKLYENIRDEIPVLVKADRGV
jgi:hypothetical protein